MIELQGSLLDLSDEVVVHPLRGVRRTHLAHGAWVDVMTGFVGGADRLYAALRRDVPWQAERRQMYDSIVDVPRLLRFYGERERLPHPALDEARDALSRPLRRRARRAVHDRRAVPLPRRARLGGLAR